MGVASIHGVMRYAIISGMEIGDTVHRTDKSGHTTTHDITSANIKYHQELEQTGYYTYEVLGVKKEESAVVEIKKEEFNFDLPKTTGTASAPRVHIAGDTCINCEG
jgi:hypothetical protein